MPATRTFSDSATFPLFGAVAAAFAFVVEVVREAVRLRRAMHGRSFDQE